jgi:hypothetical protein
MEQDISEEEAKIWVLDTLQKIEELRADILEHGIFAEDDAIEFDNKLENIKIELSKLLIPSELSEIEMRLIIKNAMINFAIVGMSISTKALIECKKLHALKGGEW